MKVGELLWETVSDIAPTYPKVYTGEKDKYFVYDITDDRGDEWGDDAPEWIHYWIRLRYYYPLTENMDEMIDKVRERLFAAGFTFAQVQPLASPEDKVDGIEWNFEYTQEREG